MFCGDWANLAPLGTKFLKSFESFDYRGLHNELLSALAELDFLLQIALQVKHAQLFVYLYFVEKLLNEEMIILPEVVHLVARYFTDGFPFFLNGVELVVGLFQGFLILVDKGAEFLKDLFLGLEVGGFLGVDFLLLFLATGAVAIIGFVERFGNGIVGGFVVVFVPAFGQKSFESLFLHFLVEDVELVADGTCSVADEGDVVVHQFVESSEQVFATHGGVVHFGFGFGLGVCCPLGCRLFGNGFGDCCCVVCVRVVLNGSRSFLLSNGLQCVVGDIFLGRGGYCIFIQIFHFDGVLFLELVL